MKIRLMALAISISFLIFSNQLFADVNVLIIGSSRDSGESTAYAINQGSKAVFTPNSKPFSPTEIGTHLQSILAQDGRGTVNVTTIDRYRTDAAGGGASFNSYSYTLAAWFHYPYPAGAETARWANLRGESGTVWNYIVLIGDPYTMEYTPGMYAHGVAKIAEEVAKSANPAQIILLMPWQGAGSSSSVNHYKEVVYRTGRSGGHKVAPAALAWQACGSPTTTGSHPNAAGAYIAAASIYSSMYNQSAAASGYVSSDANANTTFTTYTNNNTASQYTGVFSFQNPYKIIDDKRRSLVMSEKGTSTEEGFKGKIKSAITRSSVTYAEYNDSYTSNTPNSGVWVTDPMPIAFNYGRDGFYSELSKSYVINPSFWQLGFGYYYQSNTWSQAVDTANDVFIGQMQMQDNDLANRMLNEAPTARNIPNRTMWAQIHQANPTLNPLRDGSGPHLNTIQDEATGTYMYTMYSGRCPLDPKPSPITDIWNAQKVGYETAWRLGRCQTRAPGFKVLPSAATKTTILGATTETMTVQFILPPLNNVTVNITSSNPSAATVSPSTLTFTPANYSTAQSVTVTAASGLAANTPFNVVYNTVSTDEVYNGLSDSWSYTALSNLPTVAWTAATQISTAESGTLTVTAQLSASSSQAVTVPFAVTGTATGADYSITASPITIAAGATTGTSTITITSDSFHEVNGETVILTIGTPTNAQQGATLVHTATIRDDDNIAPAVNAGTDQTVLLAAGSLWTPALLTPQLWLDASTATINAGTVSVANAGSGGGTISGPAALAANGIGSLQAVQLGSGRYLTGDYTNTGATLSGFYVGKSLNATQTAYTGMMSVWASGQANDWNNVGSSVLFNQNNTTANSVQTYRNAALSSITGTLTAGFLAASVYDGSTNTAYLNGTAASGVASTGNFTAAKVGLGARWEGSAFTKNWNGNFGEAIICNANLSAADREKVEGYLAHKWGLTANLPAGHPYKTTAPSTSSTVANLDGTVSDGNGDPLTTIWSLVSGPSGVIFANSAAVDTTVTFYAPGTYTLRLTANDTYGPITNDVVITVNSTGGNSTVTYDGNGSTGGTVPVDASSPYVNGSSVTVLGNSGSLVRTGYTFNNWNTAANGSGTSYSPAATFSINTPTTLYAQWTPNSYTITFNSAGGSAVTAITQNFGTTVTAPTNPTRSGYTFTGWSPALPSTMPANSQTVTAQWTINSYTITFDSAGGSAVTAITQNFGTTVTAPTNPTRSGYTFAGWSPALPSTMLASNQTCTAQWTINSYTITFNSAGGSAVTAITQNFGATVTAPTAPTRSGYTFTGWSPALPSTMPANSQTVTAQWNALPVANAGTDQTVILSATPWSPAQLTTQLWLDADDTNTITLNGATVSQWSDKSTFGRHATAATTAQPTATAAGLNGKRVITFDGTTDVLSVNLDFLAGVSHSAFIVTKPTIFNNIYGAANGSAGANSLHVGFSNATTYRMNYWTNDYGPARTANFVAGSANIMNYIWTSGTSKQILANGKSEGTNASAGVIGTMAGGGRIGSVVGQGFFGGDIAEIVILTGSVTNADREKLEGYLAHKWGTTESLASNHPYKNSAPGGSGVVATLDGTATDADPLTYVWSVVSGPAAVTFTNASAIDTTATFNTLGTYTLRVTVSDGISQISDDVVITVSQPPYTSWSGGTFTNSFTDTAFTSNPDGDNLTNLQEFAFGMDPTSSATGSLAYVVGGNVTKAGVPLVQNFAATGQPVDYRAVFARRKDYGIAGINYAVQFSADLSLWTTSATAPTVQTGLGSSGDIEAVSVPFPSSVTLQAGGTSAPKFFRVGVSSP